MASALVAFPFQVHLPTGVQSYQNDWNASQPNAIFQRPVTMFILLFSNHYYSYFVIYLLMLRTFA